MSLITYNTVVFPYSNLTRFDQKSVWEDSNTDFYLSEFNIECQCVINSQYLALLAPALINAGSAISTNPADIQNYIYTLLMAPRKSLSVKINGVDMIPASIRGDTVDAQSGPQPQYCRFVTLTNTTFIMFWSVKAHYWINNKTNNASPVVTNQAGNSILYNRWEEVQDVDSCLYSTYTRTGRFAIRSDNTPQNTIDALRSQAAVVGVRPGFFRTSSHYTVDKSGLAMAYSVIDKEYFRKPPQPALEADGSYTESIPKNAPYFIGTANVRLRGSKQTSQLDLITTAIVVVLAKLQKVRNPAAFAAGDQQIDNGGKPQQLLSARLTFKMYENEVEFTASYRYAAGTDRKLMFASLGNVNNEIADPDSAFVPAFDVNNWRGTANIFLQAAAYYDPSLVGVVVNPNTGALTAGSQPGQI